MTRGYKELQRVTGVTGSNKGLQAVTRSYRGLQRGYTRLQGVTSGYRG